MLSRRSKLARMFSLTVLGLAFVVMPAQAQYGLILTGAGPINRSMGGTAVAAPLDAIGSLCWNPATSSSLPNSVDFGVELLYPQSRLSSSLPASAFGPGIPPIAFSGSDRGDNGVFPLPSIGLVYRSDDSNITYGLGMFAVAGFGVNYPADVKNPILSPQPPNGLGLGSLFSELQVMQIAPTASIQVTDRLSVGGGPTLSMANLRADPLFVSAPNINGSYQTGTHTRLTWGGGFQLGAFYTLDGGWHVGASYKSTQWFEQFNFTSVDNKGLPRNNNFHLNLPAITSIGVSYTAIERWILAADFRYIDFAHTAGFDSSGFDRNGALQGLGWRSIFGMSLGAQYQLTDFTSLRLGYSYGQSPILDEQSSANVVSPTMLEHTVYAGASYRVSDALMLSVAYLHGFQNSIEGPLVTPFGTVPGSSVRNTASVDSLMIGATVRFGGR